MYPTVCTVCNINKGRYKTFWEEGQKINDNLVVTVQLMGVQIIVTGFAKTVPIGTTIEIHFMA